MGERNLTPASVILRKSPKLQTWNPPESVKIGFSQPIKSCKSPWARTTSVPGRNIKWKVLPKMISAPTASISLGNIPLTVP